MTLIFIAQLLAPLALVLWLWLAPPRSRLGWATQLTGSLVLLAASARAGLWLFPPWWTPHTGAMLLLAAVLWHWQRAPALSAVPARGSDWLVVLLFAVLTGTAGYVGIRTIAGARPPAVSPVSLDWPLTGGPWLVVNGGNDLLLNAHLESLLSDDPRFIPWRGNRWAVDVVALDTIGLRADGFLPADPSRYRSYGMPVLAPCSGSVVAAVDGLPDMPVPEYDRRNLAGNHVLLACGGVHVVLAHLRRGSLRVRTGEVVSVGQRLGDVGNSGGSNEPHLHIHAQRPGPPGMPMGGEPLPMVFAGRFLVRGDRVDRPGGLP